MHFVSKKMNLRALKIHVTSTSAYSCFKIVEEPKMAPIKKKNIICPKTKETIVYNKANMKFVCGHCYVDDNGTSKPIGVMGLFLHRVGSNNLQPSCPKLGFQGVNVSANLALKKRKKALKEWREGGEIEETMNVSQANFLEFQEFKRTKVAQLENSTTTTSSFQKKNYKPLKCVSCVTFTDYNDTDTHICMNHHNCKNYICVKHLSHFGMNPHDGIDNNKLCYQCISGITKEPIKNFWCNYWFEYCYDKEYLLRTDYVIEPGRLTKGTYLWILFPINTDDGGMANGTVGRNWGQR